MDQIYKGLVYYYKMSGHEYRFGSMSVLNAILKYF